MMNIFDLKKMSDIRRVQVAHALRSISLSVVSIYEPIFLLTHGYTLSATIWFYIVFHGSGLLFALFLCPGIMKRFGLISSIKFSYPLQASFYLLLNLLPLFPWLLWPTAVIGGVTTFIYWMPINILFILHADERKMGSDLSTLFALPKIFGMIGPLLSAALIPFIGFWPMFVVASVGMLFSYLPIAHIGRSEFVSSLALLKTWKNLGKRRLLFVLEGIENVIEESEWFWGIFVFLVIGSLRAPGIASALVSFGGIAFMFLAGKYADKHARRLVPLASAALAFVWVCASFVHAPLPAYGISLALSFAMSAFMVSYYSVIYKAVKNRDEEEFMILREIPVVLGRMVVFAAVLLTVAHPKAFFVLPVFAVLALLVVFFMKRRRIDTYGE